MRGQKIIAEIRNYFKSYYFSKGLLLALSVFVAIAVSIRFFDVSVASGTVLGVLIISIPDIPGNKKHQTVGMLTALFLALLNFLFIQWALQVRFLVLPVLAVLVFANSFLSVYGFRASLVSFSGLLAMVLSFAHPLTGMDIYINLLYVTCGGLWYLLLALLLNRYRSQSYLAQLINNCLKSTALYLELRVSLYRTEKEEETYLKVLELETSIANDHQAIRDNLLHQRGRSGYHGHKNKQLLILIELVEILELAAANPIDFSKYRDQNNYFQEVVNNCASVIEILAARLKQLSNRKNRQKTLKFKEVEVFMKKAFDALGHYEKQERPDLRDKRFLLGNLSDYTQKQANNVKAIERYLTTDKPFKKHPLKRKERDLFIAVQDYSPIILWENLSLGSPIFKHCLRLTLTMLTGYLLGSFFSVQHAYWIILTIVVIMRPGYVLTKERAKDRAIGTLIGGAVAVGLLFLTQDTTAFAVLAFVSLTLAFSLIQQNYKAAAAFITLTLIFTYALITPNAYTVIQYRVMDTLMGVLLAGLANFFLWPSWENQTIHQLVEDSVGCNHVYLKEVEMFYGSSAQLSYSYKAARKKAFLSMANLHAGYQRMVQEPVAQHRHLDLLYEVVVTNHSLLSAIASLGTYIQIHKPTQPSENNNAIFDMVISLLDQYAKLLADHEMQELPESKAYQKSYRELGDDHKSILQTKISTEASNYVGDNAEGEKNEEGRILLDQLNWLNEATNNLGQALMRYRGQKS